jgi:WhiB family redox-sensing transcriptional regulator
MAPMQRPDASMAANAELDTIIMVPAGPAQAFTLPTPNGMDLPCTEDPELFFAEAPADVEAAKALCQGCAARAECLEGALDRREPWGVWGGELLLRGTVVPRKRPRGRPRKDDQGFEATAAVAKAAEQAALPVSLTMTSQARARSSSGHGHGRSTPGTSKSSPLLAAHGATGIPHGATGTPGAHDATPGMTSDNAHDAEVTHVFARNAQP